MTGRELLETDFVRRQMDKAMAYVGRETPRATREYLTVYIDDPTQMESPLEAAFYIWWTAVAVGWYPAFHLTLRAQRRVVTPAGTFRVDFMVEPARPWFGDCDTFEDAAKFEIPVPNIAIELDGHEFHERTKEQVALRDRRDRELQAAGWHVFHFSGSEIHHQAEAVVAGVYQACFKIFRDFHFAILNRRFPDEA